MNFQAGLDVLIGVALIAQVMANRAQIKFNRNVLEMFKELRANRELRDALEKRKVEDD